MASPAGAEPAVSVPAADRLRPIDAAAWIVCGLAVSFGVWALPVGWHHSIFDLHQWPQESGRVGALVACGESRGLAVIAPTVQQLSLAGRPSYRAIYCNVYFPRDRMPPRDVRFP